MLRICALLTRSKELAAAIAEKSKISPLFRVADKTKRLIKDDYGGPSIRQMIKRRLSDAGLPELFSPPSCRVTVVTGLLNRKCAFGGHGCRAAPCARILRLDQAAVPTRALEGYARDCEVCQTRQTSIASS
jgi:hypothetical protein